MFQRSFLQFLMIADKKDTRAKTEQRCIILVVTHRKFSDEIMIINSIE